MNIPYTYYLQWHTGMKYYGVRYAMDCHPDDLFVTYFTSSKYVADYIKEHGMPCIIEIRKTFTDINRITESLNWENRVLTRLGAAKREDYLNKRDSKGINYNDPAVFTKRNENMKQAINTPSAKEKRRLTDTTPETKERRRQAALRREADPDKRHKRLKNAFSQSAISKRKESFAKTAQTSAFIEKRRIISKETNSRPEVMQINREKNSGLNNARAIKETFTFRNKSTGETKLLTCYEMTLFLRTQGIKYAQASNLVRMRTKSLAGWEYVSNND